MNPTSKYYFTNSINRPGKRIARPVYATVTMYVILLTAVLLLLFLPFFRAFTVCEEKTGKILYLTGVGRGDTFSVKYIHSVNKSPVEDVFEIQQDYGIMLVKTIFLSFGAGVPYELDSGQVFHQSNGKMVIDNINRRIDTYLLRVGTIAEHTVCIRGREIRLDRIIKPKSAVQLEVRLVPFITYLRGIIFDE